MLTNEAWVNVRASLQMKFSAPPNIVRRSPPERIRQHLPAFAGVASRGGAAPSSQATSFPPKASSRCARPRASTREASTSCQGQGTVRSHEPTSCSGKAEIGQYRSPWLSHPVGSHAGIGYRCARGSFNVAPKLQGFVGSHRQPDAQAGMQSNPAFEPTAPGVSLQLVWQHCAAGVCGSTQR